MTWPASPSTSGTDEYRCPRFAELDAQIKAQAPVRAHAAAKPNGRRPRKHAPLTPKQLRKETAEFARALKKRYPKQFTSDRKLKERVARLLKSMLPPKPRRRGRPGIDSVTEAIAKLRKLEREHPDERPAHRWHRIYAEVIPNYARMNEHHQKQARSVLRERVRSRLRARKIKHRKRENSRQKSPSRNPA